MVASKAPKDAAKEVENTGIDWSKVTDLNEARAALGVVVDISELLGDGSEFIKDKNVLIGSPFMILDWRFNKDGSGREYVNVLVMGSNGEKVRFNDGGTGVYAQIKAIQDECGKVGVMVKGGLRKSDYTFENEKGVKTAAITFYLAV